MTRFKKRVSAVAAAILLVAGVLTGLLAFLHPKNAVPASAIAEIASTDERLDVREDTVYGFKSGAVLPDNVSLTLSSSYRIADRAFEACSQLVRVYVEEGFDPSLIGVNAFDKCTRLVEIATDSGALTEKMLKDASANANEFGGLAYYALNVHTGNTNAITDDADGCYYITDNVKSNDNALYVVGADVETAGSDGVLTLPKLEKEYAVYNYAFHQLAGVKKVVVKEGAQISEIGQLAFYECPDLEEVDLSGGSVKSIAYSAFTRTTKLTSLKLSAALQSVGGYAFNGCTSLAGELTVPASVTSIGTNAFAGCSLLSKVTFEGGSENLTIAAAAFNGCSAVKVLELPSNLTNLEAQAFTDTGLTDVYLNSAVNFVASVTTEYANVYFPTTALVIYASADAYNAEMNNNTTNAMVHHGRMTHLITLQFKEGSKTVSSLTRLKGQAFGFVQDGDKHWANGTGNPEDAIPKQGGYAQSVWYKEEQFATKVNTLNLFNNLLAEATTDTVELYAKRIEKPTLTAKTDLVYKEGERYTADGFTKFVNENVGLDSALTGEIVGYPDGVEDADTYTFQVSIENEDAYGAWESNFTLEFTIQRQPVSVVSAVAWQLNGHNLLDGSLYVYQNASNELVYSSTVIADPAAQGLTYHSVLTLTNSIARNGGTLSVSLNTNPAYTIGDYVNQTASGLGRQESSVTVTANENYLLTNFGDNVATDSSRGVTVQVAPDGLTAIVSKVWYVVEIGNHMVAAGTETPFTVPGWTFGQGSAITAPNLRYGTAADLERVTFTVTKDETRIGEFDFARFANVINATMPAGNYKVSFAIPTVGEYTNTTDELSFTVDRAPFAQSWKDAIAESFQEEFSARFDGNLKLYTAENLTGWDCAVPAFTKDEGSFWGDSYYDNGFTLTYNFAGAQNREYYSFAQLSGLGEAAYLPKQPNTYTVYYNFTAQNYEPLVDVASAARTDCGFTVTVYRVIALPTVAALTYTGNRMLPAVTEGEQGTSALYEIIYDTTENSYVNAGTNHQVAVRLTDGAHYKWANGAGYFEEDQKSIAFTINRADNTYSVGLSVPQWTYGNFNMELHTPRWSTVFYLKEADFYTYTLTNKDDPSKVYAFDKTEGFNQVPIGTYTLTATAKGYYKDAQGTEHNAGYNWNQYTQKSSVIIAKGVNTWKVTPNVMQWEYGSYVKSVNLILAEASIEDANNPVKFKITYDAAGQNAVAGLESFTAGKDGIVSDEVAAVLEGLRVSAYYLWSSVETTNEYVGITPLSGFEFKVTKSENYWDEAPAVSTWIVGSYNDQENTITAKPHFGGTVNYKIVATDDEGKVIFDTENGINELATAGVGVYELRATVAGTDDYADLTYTLVFRIFEKAGLAWWAILLIVLAALALVALVLFILHQRGVLQVLTGKVVLAMRTRATVDATIAAVRANKVAEDAKQSLASAEAKEAEEARRRAIEEAKSRPLDERAEVLEELAREEAERAGKLQKRADNMYLTAEKMRQRANKTRETLESQAEEAADEAEEPASESATDNDQPNE